MSTIEIQTPSDQALALLAKAKEIYHSLERNEDAFRNNRQRILEDGWRLGSILAQIKETIPHGKWLHWLGGHWREMEPRNAQRCMAFFAENPNAWNSTHLKTQKIMSKDEGGKVVAEVVIQVPQVIFTDESIRKFMWGYIPEKHRPQIDGDEPVKRATHYLTVVNSCAKFCRQFRAGHVKADVDAMRRDFQPIIPQLIEILGEDWIRSLLEK